MCASPLSDGSEEEGSEQPNMWNELLELFTLLEVSPRLQQGLGLGLVQGGTDVPLRVGRLICVHGVVSSGVMRWAHCSSCEALTLSFDHTR